jgi:glutamate--cysteine ligase
MPFASADLQGLDPGRLLETRRGIEKESLRVNPDGSLALTPHPAALGSALTHPHITTDYSEAQLELITGVQPTPEACLRELLEIHQFTARALGDEQMWVASMPCQLPPEDRIPIGRYGRSNVGQAKSVYRMGLAHRYGRRMQTISGIHYNWSMPGTDSAGYFALIRNFRRHAFLLLYLFGASPALCACFVEGRAHGLQQLSDSTLFLPHATSLRMGRLGYQSEAQATLAVSYNDLDGYAASLQDALTRPYPPYEAIGIRGPDGDYRQLATSLLQIENEFYGTIRPKRSIFPGERPLHALRERGVEYVEVRLMDLDPFEPLGIRVETMRFLDVFLLYCLRAPSAADTPTEIARLGRNQQRVAERGREPGLMLEGESGPVSLQTWGEGLLAACEPVAQHLDRAFGLQDRPHAAAVAQARQLLQAPEALPSARVLQALAREHEQDFGAFGRAQSRQTLAWIRAQPWAPTMQAHFQALSAQSMREQARIEAADSLPFEQYRQQYIAPERLGLGRGAIAPGLTAA